MTKLDMGEHGEHGERLARIEEALKYIAARLDAVVEQKIVLDAQAATLQTRLSELWTAVKINRVFIGLSLVLAGGGAFVRYLGVF